MHVQHVFCSIFASASLFATSEARRLCRIQTSKSLVSHSTFVGSTSIPSTAAYSQTSASSSIDIPLSSGTSDIFDTQTTTSASSTTPGSSTTTASDTSTTILSDSSTTSTTLQSDTTTPALEFSTSLSTSIGTSTTSDDSSVSTSARTDISSATTGYSSTSDTVPIPTNTLGPIVTQFSLAADTEFAAVAGKSPQTRPGRIIYFNPPSAQTADYAARQFYLEDGTHYLKVADINQYLVTNTQGGGVYSVAAIIPGTYFPIQCTSPVRQGEKLQCSTVGKNADTFAVVTLTTNGQLQIVPEPLVAQTVRVDLIPF